MELKYLSGRRDGQGQFNIEADLADGSNCLSSDYIAGCCDRFRGKHWKMPYDWTEKDRFANLYSHCAASSINSPCSIDFNAMVKREPHSLANV